MSDIAACPSLCFSAKTLPVTPLSYFSIGLILSANNKTTRFLLRAIGYDDTVRLDHK